jgi:uncharacterized protein YjbI with pentapeptide repeats
MQGASLARRLGIPFGSGTELEGAMLEHAELQGASLFTAQLQGASLFDAIFKGAALWHVFVWRADAQNVNAEGALVDAPETGPKYNGTRSSSR